MPVGYFILQKMTDLGSSIDLLHTSAFKKMGYPLAALESHGRVLAGINGLRTTSLGDVIYITNSSLPGNPSHQFVSNIKLGSLQYHPRSFVDQ